MKNSVTAEIKFLPVPMFNLEVASRITLSIPPSETFPYRVIGVRFSAIVVNVDREDLADFTLLPEPIEEMHVRSGSIVEASYFSAPGESFSLTTPPLAVPFETRDFSS